MRRIGRRLACAVEPGELVLLYGPLGAGKTTLVRAVAQALEVTDPVRSPTFTVANVYGGGRLIVQHLDLYRLESIEDEDALALEEYVGGNAVTLVEWPEAGEARLGVPDWTVRISHETPSTRGVVIIAATEEAVRRWEAAGGQE